MRSERQRRVLDVLQDGSLRSREVAELMNENPHKIAQVLARLEQQGLVQSMPDQNPRAPLLWSLPTRSREAHWHQARMKESMMCRFLSLPAGSQL